MQGDNKDMQEVQQELPIESQEQHIIDAKQIDDTLDDNENQSNREVEERNNN